MNSFWKALASSIGVEDQQLSKNVAARASRISTRLASVCFAAVLSGQELALAGNDARAVKGDKTMVEKGDFYFKKPRLMRLEVTEGKMMIFTHSRKR